MSKVKVYIKEGGFIYRGGYEIKKQNGVLYCDCPAWKYLGGPINKRRCKHIKENVRMTPRPSAKSQFKPYVCVNIEYNSHYMFDFDNVAVRIAEQFKGEEASSGFGGGIRDISFEFYDLKNAAKFAQAMLKRKEVLAVFSHSKLHKNDFNPQQF